MPEPVARPIPKLSDLDIAFPARAMEWLPPMDEIPDKFKARGNAWTRLVGRWFAKGLPRTTEFVPKEDVDAKAAFNVVRACLGSFEPKHEHKEAGCAFLMSEWFVQVRDGDEVLAP